MWCRRQEMASINRASNAYDTVPGKRNEWIQYNSEFDLTLLFTVILLESLFPIIRKFQNNLVVKYILLMVIASRFPDFVAL